MQENNALFETIYKPELPSNDVGNLGDIYLQTFDKKEENNNKQDEFNNTKSIGLLVSFILIMMIVALIIALFDVTT